MIGEAKVLPLGERRGRGMEASCPAPSRADPGAAAGDPLVSGSEAYSGSMRPNIVFAFADDWGRYASAYRPFEGPDSLNALIDTPHFDRVAREGVLFRNAFVPAPSCTPCRSSILAGQYFWQTGLGAILQGAVWDETIPTYPLTLEEAGYHIGYTYKVWSPGRALNAPYGAERTRFEPAGSEFGRFSHAATEWVPEKGVEGAKRTLLDETRTNFDAFLEAREDDRPFCYWWGPTNTHRTWEQGSGKALWGLDPDDLKGRLPAFLPDVHEAREDVCDYLGECLAVDAGLGVLLERLEPCLRLRTMKIDPKSPTLAGKKKERPTRKANS